MSSNGDESTVCPRLCHLIKWPDFDGYGFNLHAEKAKSGQYIGKVDDDSPAQLAGLREGDRIIEVNLVNISNENHRQVVERIKSVPNETKLLVIDESADKWYKENKLIVKSSQSNVIHYKTPVPRPNTSNSHTKRLSPPTTPTINSINGDKDKDKDQDKDEDEDENQINDNTNGINGNTNGIKHNVELNHKTNGTITAREDSPVLENGANNSSGGSTPRSVTRSQVTSTESMNNNRPSSGGSNTNTSIPGSPTSSKSGSSFSGPSRQLSENGADLNLNMSASEMRKILAQRKKHDAKKAQIDLKQKYEIIQQM